MRDSLAELPGDGQVKARLLEACKILGIDPEEASRFEPPSEIAATLAVAARALSALAVEQAKRIAALEKAVFPQEME